MYFGFFTKKSNTESAERAKTALFGFVRTKSPLPTVALAAANVVSAASAAVRKAAFVPAREKRTLLTVQQNKF